jgi:hypothetical protein
MQSHIDARMHAQEIYNLMRVQEKTTAECALRKAGPFFNWLRDRLIQTRIHLRFGLYFDVSVSPVCREVSLLVNKKIAPKIL